MASKQSEKERKRIEIQKRKFQLEQQRITKPPECYKFLKAIVNNQIVQQNFGSKITERLKSIEIKADIKSSTTPGTITWKRIVSKRIISEEGEVVELGDVESDEPYLLVILRAEEFVKAAKDNQLLNILQAAQEVLSFDPSTTILIIFGLKEFCRRHKNVIGIKETEIKLTQLQLLANCSHRLHETPDDVALSVLQFSKAIAEEPFKAKQNQKLDQEQLYLTSDTKTNVNLDDPASLGRLWHTQLTALPKVTYEVAQSIIKEYPLPKNLLDAYRASSNPAKMLAEISIIRTGPMAKTRRIGPELSRKIHTLMTSNNPDDVL